ncbi:uncharacterized protein LTHEOB_9795 [Neofusicoccum parvum]|uniref:Uncharacterized protein LTHEOB_9795 n=1 Tax=Neofusicoccum parvum TaxID=310453 RepID=A0ACB5S1K8_9PEZI|nr:uncharacterized protein LTHEOB_9795 [Neofusicoccum parvum]
MGIDEQNDVEHGSQATTNPADDLPAAAVAGDLLNRTNTLLSELEAFNALLETHRRPPILGHRAFIQDVNAEKRFIERLLQKALAETNSGPEATPNGDDDHEDPLAALEADRRIKHQLSSTNITSYEAQWAAVKRCRGLTALRQTFSRQPPSVRRARKEVPRAASPSSKIKAHVRKTQDNVLVDAVVDNGATWLKVSAISERQLLFQMARQGWQNASDDSDSDGSAYGKPIGGAANPADDEDSDDEDEVVVVRLAKHLTQAARANRHAYRHPRIHLALPKIRRGRVKEIDALLTRIRNLSSAAAPLVLETGGEEGPPPTTAAAPDLTPLLTDPHASFTPTLNIDCTLLVALASDISHARCAEQPWYPTAVRAQIRDERRAALMPLHLYPALGGRRLVCTRAAARRMREIVATIGTESEVLRAGLLLGGGDGDDDGAPDAAEGDEDEEGRRQDLLDAFQRWSIYPVPRELRLPISVVEGEGGEGCEVVEGDHTAASGDGDGGASESRPRLPRVAAAVAAQLTDINRSIFLHGWATGCTTLSSNGTVAKQIETLVEQHRTCDEEVGPDVWLCPVARSLVAKKGRQT